MSQTTIKIVINENIITSTLLDLVNVIEEVVEEEFNLNDFMILTDEEED